MSRIRKHLRNGIFRGFTALIAVVYVFSILLTDVIHPLVHQHQEIGLHTAINEQDPCHRAIYHGEKETREGHHNHVTQTDQKCWLCDIIIHHDQLPVHDQPKLAAGNVPYHRSFDIIFSSFAPQPNTPSRAPPAVV